MDNSFVVLCCLCFHLALSHGSVGKFSIMPILSRFAGGVPVFLKLAYIYSIHIYAMQYSIYLRIL